MKKHFTPFEHENPVDVKNRILKAATAAIFAVLCLSGCAEQPAVTESPVAAATAEPADEPAEEPTPLPIEEVAESVHEVMLVSMVNGSFKDENSPGYMPSAFMPPSGIYNGDIVIEVLGSDAATVLSSRQSEYSMAVWEPFDIYFDDYNGD